MNFRKVLLILGIIVIVAIVGVSAFLFIPSDNNTNISNNNTNNISTNNSSDINISSNSSENNIVFTNHKGKTDKNNVTATANCQKTVYQGNNASIIWKVTNNGNETIKNVVASSQGEVYKFGNIKPGETKTHEFSIYVTTNKDLEIDFDMKDGQWPGPFSAGAFGLNYSLNGEDFSTLSNECSIDVKI